MGWSKTEDGGFAYNEGSLNFTLRGSAFYDSNGDGVPDGVTFENGRPVFMGIKNLHDFHFDVPRGYIIVNGNEYKLVDLDKNPDNGEELQLFKENVGFPQGNDRTNPAAYKKVAEHQFTYNEGSLNYTLTGGAFYDSNGDGKPDGVQIIGPKPCFGADGTIFDTSVENFHFKVPSGSLIVNGQRYELAELDVLGVINMTKEKNIDASAEKDKFADEILSDDELENVAGGVGGKGDEPFGRNGENSSEIKTTGKISPPITTGK